MSEPKSMAHAVWRDLTPVGRWTIGVPLVIMCYLTMIVIAPFVVVLFILVKIGLVSLIERTLTGAKYLIFKKEG